MVIGIEFSIINQINWYGARDACKRKGLKHATLRNPTELNELAVDLRLHGFSNNIFKNICIR